MNHSIPFKLWENSSACDENLSEELLDEGLPCLANRQSVKSIQMHSSDEILNHKGSRIFQNNNEYNSCNQLSVRFELDESNLSKRSKYQTCKVSHILSHDMGCFDKDPMISGSLKEDVRFLLRCNIAQKMLNTKSATINRADDISQENIINEEVCTPDFENVDIICLRKFSSITINDIMPANECNN